jgi:hypothetical protein
MLNPLPESKTRILATIYSPVVFHDYIGRAVPLQILWSMPTSVLHMTGSFERPEPGLVASLAFGRQYSLNDGCNTRVYYRG